MSETKFTTGPWEVEYDGSDIEGSFTLRMETAIEDPGCHDAVHSIELYDGIWEEEGEEQFSEAKANTHLIAAAPEIYEALSRMMLWAETIHSLYPHHERDGGSVSADLAMARSVLAKARGEA